MVLEGVTAPPGEIESPVDHPLGPPRRPRPPLADRRATSPLAIAAVELVLLLVIGGGALVEAASARLQLEARDHALACPG